MKKIAFICPYFGKLPNHCQLWLNSCEKNSNITWFLLTDDKTSYRYPSNVIVKYTSLEELREEYQKKFDFKISLPGVYKLGDYKPLFGYLHEDLIKGYDAWGHIDVADEIYGDIRKFVTDDLLEKYDKLMFFGHMCIYKNTPEVNMRFMEKSDIPLTYKQIFSSDKFYNFEEFATGSITRIYIQNNWSIGRLDDCIADISGISYPFKLGKWSEDYNTLNYYKRKPLIFSWENGKVFGYSLENRKICKKEYLYVHFKRRKMKVDVRKDAKQYLIVPDGFCEMTEEVSKRKIKINSRFKFYDVYFKEKKKVIKVKFTPILKKIEKYKISNIIKRIFRKLPASIYLKLKFYYIFRKKLNLKNPKSFNEKLQWLKLYNQKDEYTSMVDKYDVKSFVSERIGEEHIIKTIGIFDNFDDIDFNTLPKQFVIKCTHDSGGIIICKDKELLDISEARKKINECLENDFYSLGKEWPYKNVKPRIIVEEYMVDESEVELKDYKVFCFNGEPKYIQLDYDRFTNHHRNIYDTKWNIVSFEIQYKSDRERTFNKPSELEEMLKYAAILSKGIPFLRCDFYIVKGRVYFGEMTFFPESGFGKFTPEVANIELGNLLNLK